MKTLLFFFAGLLMCSGQILVGEDLPETKTLSNGSHLGLEITYNEGENDNAYVMTFRNRRYFELLDFRHISFIATPEELQDLYYEWDSLFDSQKERTYVLNESKIMAIPKGDQIYFYVDSPGETDSFFFMKRKHLSRAFGL